MTAIEKANALADGWRFFVTHEEREQIASAIREAEREAAEAAFGRAIEIVMSHSAAQFDGCDRAATEIEREIDALATEDPR